MTEEALWPRKTREFQTRHFDSTFWNDFPFRDDDIIIGTYAKSGTTWVQQIVAQLLFRGDPNLNTAGISPWLDMRLPPKADKLAMLEAQKHRRFIKTHLPADALVVSPKARYLYVARDGRDVAWSLYNHFKSFTQENRDRINNLPGVVGPLIELPPDDIRQFWRAWLDRDGYPSQPFWDHVRSWWAIRHVPNVLMVHFAKLKVDAPTEIRRIAAFLDIPIDEARWELILEHCSFDWMKANATRMAPNGGVPWEGGAQTFIHRGVNGRWSETLTPEEILEYEARAVRELGSECAHWLATGESR
jgi:aryl sulfotransferase